MVTVDEDLCTGCGQCTETCPAQILVLEEGKAQVKGDPTECLGCESCTTVCEVSAIAVNEY